MADDMIKKNEAVFAKLLKKINRSIVPTKKEIEETALEIVWQIRTRTRLGKGITKKYGGSLTKLRKLSPNYIQVRRGNAIYLTDPDNGETFFVERYNNKSLKAYGKSDRKALRDLNKYMKRARSNLSPETRPARSNLTATGQLLNSLKYKILQIGLGRIIISFNEKRKTDLYGNPTDVKNSEIVKHQRKLGRSFFGVSKAEKGLIQRDLVEKMRNRLKF